MKRILAKEKKCPYCQSININIANIAIALACNEAACLPTWRCKCNDCGRDFRMGMEVFKEPAEDQGHKEPLRLFIIY
jgi:hypothetical protein